MNFTRDNQQEAKLIQQAYRQSRDRTFKYKGQSYQYTEDKSSDLWAWYENATNIIIGIHGADDVNLNLIALQQFFDPNMVQDQIEDFCDTHADLINSDKNVFIVAHSLGTWIVSSCEVENRNSNITGTFFGPYVPRIDNEKANFMASTSKFKKIFYDNDWFASNLLKISPLNNALILTPSSIPFTFINGHSITNFADGDITLLNIDVKKFNKPKREEEKKEEKEESKLSTNLTIMSYNVKMLNPLFFSGRSKDRARWIPEQIHRQYPGVDIVIVQELFDDDAEDIFDKKMRQQGFTATNKVGSNSLQHGKLDDGGVKIYSKLGFSGENHTVFKDGDKADQLVAKGGVKINVNKGGIDINIVGTHLQSGRKHKSIKNKKKQFDQLNDKLVKKEAITIIGGDMNIDRFSQQSLLNQVVEDNDLEFFDYGSGFTTGNDFSGGQKKWLDHFFKTENDDFNVSGTINVVLLEKPGGYSKPKEEILSGEGILDKGEEFVEKGVDLLRTKKQRKRRKRRHKKKTTRHVESLSDHNPVIITMQIWEKGGEQPELPKQQSLIEQAKKFGKRERKNANKIKIKQLN